MDELQVEIWDFLYREKAARSIEVIAQHVDREPEAVRVAVEHHWFDVADDVVAIAKEGG